MSSDADARRATERCEFRKRLAETAALPEPTRVNRLIMHLRDILHSPYVSPDECFKAVYGSEGSTAFWRIQCSEPIAISSFVHLLATTGSRFEADFIPRSKALWAAMFSAYQSGERAWFVGDVTVLDGVNYSCEVPTLRGLERLKLLPRDAAEWLERMPKRRHLLPDSLAEFLDPTDEPGATNKKPKLTQKEVNTLLLSYFERAKLNGDLPPKRDHQVWPDLRAAGATHDQMLAAMKSIPAHLKRSRGQKDRK